MDKIASFTVDHTVLEKGVYVSRVDGDITTYDIRMRKPNTGDLMSNSAMHSFEHMLATFMRNSILSDDIIYCGPMGCQTGFYVLVRNSENEKFLNVLKSVLNEICAYDGDMFGASPVECGNYINLSLAEAKKEAKAFLEILKAPQDFTYKVKETTEE